MYINILNFLFIGTYIVNVGKQSVITKDNLTVWIDAVVYSRTIDTKKTTYRLRDPVNCVTGKTEFYNIRVISKKHLRRLTLSGKENESRTRHLHAVNFSKMLK